ncbi:neprilysin-1-like [Chrysoperla carnea]|uniref:neprilysin-1-like n=1 Tax=Chrysoperla carnea TaxID=189513 RepID=UPI001D093F31|nr:neprilysin-1-like [Chrysoperla carnea]
MKKNVWKLSTPDQSGNGFLQQNGSSPTAVDFESTNNLSGETVPLAAQTVVHLGGTGAVLYQPPRPPTNTNNTGSTTITSTTPLTTTITPTPTIITPICTNKRSTNSSNNNTNSHTKLLYYFNTREWCLMITIFLLSFLLILCISALTASTYSCNGRTKNGALSRPVCLTQECVRTASSLLSAMDHSADPCVDFFQFACGTWNKKHMIPEDRSSISTFEVLADQLQVLLKGVLEEPIDYEKDNSATIKAKMFYKSCMDIPQIRKLGDEPLRQVLSSLGGWPVITKNWTIPDFSWETLLGRLRREYNEGILIEEWVGPDDKNSSVNIIQLDQMQLALPSRDYYLKTSSEGDMEAYHKYMTQVAILLGANATLAKEDLRDVVEFERRLANASLPEADRHDTSAIYKKLSVAQLQKAVPQLKWLDYFNALMDTEITNDEPVVAYAMTYFTEMGRILGETDRRVIHNYIIWRLVMNVMPHMIDEYQHVRVEFRKILLGILSDRNRWAQCVEVTNKKMGMAVGALFIRDNFNHESKVTALEMIHTIREAFNELLAENVWMDDETRAVAKAKADAMNERIGYPELLTATKELEAEYVTLNVTNSHFLLNIFNVLRYDAFQNLKKLRQPVDKNKWTTEPAVVNAFYNPNKNDIVFPAGILQPLFYSQHFPKSLNYGGIGVVIGHEITHGFDDKGRQFDKDGNMMQWWNNATIRAFRNRAQCIIDQYSKFRIEEVGLYVNGRMTQGENIADNGGLKQSFRAYKKWEAQHGPEPDLPGLNMTHDQLFFLNYAQIWCGSMRPEDALTKIRSSVHSPGPVRVLGPLSNSWDFAKAYNCPLGSPMNPKQKCSVW